MIRDPLDLMLGAAVLATNPLSPSSVAVLLGFCPDNTFHLLSSIPSLPVLHDVNHPVRLLHKSFRDVITGPACWMIGLTDPDDLL